MCKRTPAKGPEGAALVCLIVGRICIGSSYEGNKVHQTERVKEKKKTKRLTYQLAIQELANQMFACSRDLRRCETNESHGIVLAKHCSDAVVGGLAGECRTVPAVL